MYFPRVKIIKHAFDRFDERYFTPEMAAKLGKAFGTDPAAFFDFGNGSAK